MNTPQKSSPQDSSSLIRFENARLGYGTKTILQNVSCQVRAGDYAGLVGPNGSGKTTFLRAVLGMLRPLEGTVTVSPHLKFSYVPQMDELNLLWPMTLREVAALPYRSRRLLGRIAPAELAHVDDALAKVGLTAIANRLLSEVSGGQRQRAILAQALCQKPQVLLLDEPTQGLDVVAERDLLQLIDDIRQENDLTVLMVTHTLQIPLNFTEKIFLFQNGSMTVTDPDELIRTDKLQEVYGIPFLHQESGGVRWATPKARTEVRP